MNTRNFEKNKEQNGPNSLTNVLFFIYLIALFWILLLKLGVRFSYMENRRINLIPFYEPLFLNGKFDFVEIIMNVIIFIPLGVYTGILYKRWSWMKHISFFSLLSLLVESLQFILKLGSFDMTDTITNTLGGVFGLLVFKVIERMLNSSSKAQKIINTVALIGTISMIVLLLLLKLNMLPIKYQ